MIKTIFASALLLLSNLTLAQDPPPAEVMLIGVFHFSNPGLDAIKTEQINVMTEENQSYLKDVANHLAEFSPTHILLECVPESAQQYTQELIDYLAGNLELEVNESYQLGFRIAENAGLNEIHCYDDRSVEWKIEPVMARMSQAQPDVMEKFNDTVQEITLEIETLQRTQTLEELLVTFNSTEFDDRNKGIYLTTNAVGAGAGFEGAEATASWWQRNFRMYANIQTVAKPGTRVIVIGGQGHTAILKDLLKLDYDRNFVSVLPYFQQ